MVLEGRDRSLRDAHLVDLIGPIGEACPAGLLEHVREEDIPCRYGGEEFTIILPGADLAASRDRAEELRHLISSMTVQWDGQIISRLSVSLGVSCFPLHGTTWQQALKAADKALYAAKQTGRKRVVVAPL